MFHQPIGTMLCYLKNNTNTKTDTHPPIKQTRQYYYHLIISTFKEMIMIGQQNIVDDVDDDYNDD